MGQHSIIEKLGSELTLPLTRESQVLYLMAEIRKYIEHEHEKDKGAYRLLEFFCNWALHIRISRPHQADNIRIFLDAFDLEPGVSMEQYLRSDFFNPIMHLEVLKRELTHFLNQHSLQLKLAEDQRTWLRFIYFFTSIVSVVPLEYAKGDLLPDDVKELTITRLEEPRMRQKLVKWAVILKDGTPLSATTLYGILRNERGETVAMPDFLDDSCQA